jgi:diguanylate cyclase (GGDEF)-like protein/PAS domain S-box-containing protein
MSTRDHDYLLAILEHSADAIVTTDHNSRIVLWNSAAERMFGWRKEEIVGRPAEEVWVEPEERRRLIRLVEKKGRVIDYETRLLTKEGHVIEISATMSQLRDDQGRLLGTLCISKDIRKRKKMERQLKKMAITDMLTGLYNRAHFNRIFFEEVERARRMRHPLALALADLDGFKTYNDTKGHQAGDSALKTLGRAVLAVLRKHVDTAYRYGGDEFTFIFPETEGENALHAAERMRQTIEREVGPAITASIGLAWLKEGRSAKELLRAADQAMYRAKAAGGNRVEVE